MTALPINPTDEQLVSHVLDSIPETNDLDVVVRAAFQTGVEAERARAAAEAGRTHLPGDPGHAVYNETGDALTELCHCASISGHWVRS